MRWFGPAVIAIVGTIIIFGNPITKTAFCSIEQHCIREWLSAIGSFSAVIFGLHSTVLVFRQISDAERHHREIVNLERQQSLALARNVLSTAEEVGVLLNRERILSKRSDANRQAVFDSTLFNLRMLQMVFMRDVFREMERTIEPPRYPNCSLVLATISRSVDYFTILEKEHLYLSSDAEWAVSLQMGTRAFQLAGQYAVRAREVAQRYIEGTN